MSNVPVCLVVGEEDFLLREEARSAVAQAGEQAVVERYWAAETDPLDILMTLAVLPLWAPRKVVIVWGIEAWRADRLEKLVPYCRDPAGDSTLILVGRRVAHQALRAAVAKTGTIITCDSVPAVERTGWVRRLATRHRCTLAPQAVDYLVQLTAGDLGQMANEVAKLALYVGSRPATVEDLQAVAGGSPTVNAFRLLDAVSAGDAAEALSLTARLLDGGEPPLRLLGLLHHGWRQWWLRPRLRQTGPPDDSPSAASLALSGFGLLFEADLALKGGSCPSHLTMEWLVIALARLMRAGRRQGR